MYSIKYDMLYYVYGGCGGGGWFYENRMHNNSCMVAGPRKYGVCDSICWI